MCAGYGGWERGDAVQDNQPVLEGSRHPRHSRTPHQGNREFVLAQGAEEGPMAWQVGAGGEHGLAGQSDTLSYQRHDKHTIAV